MDRNQPLLPAAPAAPACFQGRSLGLDERGSRRISAPESAAMCAYVRVCACVCVLGGRMGWGADQEESALDICRQHHRSRKAVLLLVG